MESNTRLDPAKLLGFKLQAKQDTKPTVLCGAKIGKPPAPGIKLGAKIGNTKPSPLRRSK